MPVFLVCNSSFLKREADKATREDETPPINQTSVPARSSNSGSAFGVTKNRPAGSATTGTSYKQDGQTAVTTISNLPVELLSSIVRRFHIGQWKRLELVNKQFRAAVLIAWRELRLVDFKFVLGYEYGKIYWSRMEALEEQERIRNFLETLVVRSPLITKFTIRNTLCSQMLSLVIQHISRFEHFEALSLCRRRHVDPTNLLERTMDAIFRRLNPHQNPSCNNEEELTETMRVALSRISLQELVYQSVSPDRGMSLLQMNVDQLRSLNLGSSIIDFDVLNQLLPRCKTLTHLDLSATDYPIVALSDNNFFVWLRTAKSLTSFKLNSVDVYEITIRAPIWSAELERSLFELGSFQALTELEMMDSEFCTDAMINVIAVRLANCLKILRLDIRYCTEAALLNLVSSMVNLERLSFWSYENALIHCSISDNVSDEVVSAIAANLSKLVALDLCYPSASANALTSLIELEKLQELIVVGAFDDETLVTVASALGHQLINLQIPISSRISDKGVVAALQHLHKLRYLVLSGTEISDKTLVVLSGSCFELRRLGLVGCRNITSHGAQAVIGCCTKLEELSLRGSAVDVGKLKKCDGIWKRFKQISFLDKELVAILDQFPDYLDCSNSTWYWYWTYFSSVCWQIIR